MLPLALVLSLAADGPTFAPQQPVVIGRVAVDDGKPQRALVLEAGPCGKERARTLAVALVVDGAGERGRVALEQQVGCGLVTNAKSGGVDDDGSVEYERSEARALPFQLDAKERALLVEWAAGYEHVSRAKLVVVADEKGPRVALASAIAYGMGGWTWAADVERKGDHDELVEEKGQRYGGSLDETTGFVAQRHTWDRAKRAMTAAPLPVWAVVLASADAKATLADAPDECRRLDPETFATDDFALLAKGKRIRALLFLSEQEAKAKLTEARAKCAEDAYVKRAR